ncbi:hypothetical protein [Chromobacterium sp. Beijing]|nr:hypothetical protein [Chromobacterium sp. Beijing]UJB31621.1 AAA family ATPase [Chromobacterium sp. Beijing]
MVLHLPEAKGDGASNITTHQMLRVIYADQPSLHSPIFRDDSFDTSLTRSTVGNYLCGIYNDELYTNQITLRDLEKERDKLNSELKGIYTVLAKSGQISDINFLSSLIIDAEENRNTEFKKLSELKAGRNTSEHKNKDNSIEAQLRENLSKAKLEFLHSRNKLQKHEFEAADTERFISEIQLRLENLRDSTVVRSSFGKLNFHVCPACLSELKRPSDENSCGLCCQHLDADSANTQIIRMRNELAIQLKESTIILNEKIDQISKLKIEIPSLSKKLNQLESQYYLQANNWSSATEELIEASARKLGELDQEIKNLFEQQKLASTINGLRERLEELEIQIINLKSSIDKLSFVQDIRKKETYSIITENLTHLLKSDLPRQSEFENAKEISISFEDNQITVNGSRKFSESSTVVLRHLFHIAMLTASTQLSYMRLPRLLILDGIEDGGMELARSHRLQEIIVNETRKYECDYQLIFATSQISPQLDNEEFVVDRSYSEQEKSLSIY